MAATITTSMAGDLLKKVSPPIEKKNEVDGKLKLLKDQLTGLKKMFSPKTREAEQEKLVQKFKSEIGFDEFPIRDQKAMISEINVYSKANFDMLNSIEDSLNNVSSMLYKNMTKTVDLTLAKTTKSLQIKKSVIEQLAETVKLKIQNIAPIKTLSNSFTSLKTMISRGFSTVFNSMDNAFSRVSKSISDFGYKIMALSPVQKLKDFITTTFEPIISVIQDIKTGIKFIADIFSVVISGIRMVSSIIYSAFSFVGSVISTVGNFIFSKVATIPRDIFNLVVPYLENNQKKLKTIELQNQVLDKKNTTMFGKIFGFFTKSLKPFIGWVNSTLKVAIDWVWTVFKAAWEYISYVIDTEILGMLIAFSPEILIISAIAIGLLILIIIFRKQIWEFLKTMWGYLKEVWTYLKPKLEEFFKWLWNVFKVAWEFWQPIFKSVFDWIIEKFEVAWDWWVENFPAMWDTLVGWITTAWEWWKEALPKIWDWLKNQWDLITSFWEDAFDDLMDGIQIGWEWLKNQWDLISTFWTNAFNATVATIQAGWDWLKNQWDLIFSFWRDFWNDHLQPVVDWIVKTLTPVVEWLWDTYKAGWEMIASLIQNIWEFLTNPEKFVKETATKVGTIVSDEFSKVTNTLSDWSKNVVSAINPMNWFADGKVALEPVRAVIAEAGPEAAIPLNEKGLAFLRKTFNIDDNSFNSVLNKSDLFKAIMDIKEQTMQIKDVVDSIESKMMDMQSPSYFESITEKTVEMYKDSPPTPDGSKSTKQESFMDKITKEFSDIKKMIKNNSSAPADATQVFDSEMNVMKMISTGIIGRRQ